MTREGRASDWAEVFGTEAGKRVWADIEAAYKATRQPEPTAADGCAWHFLGIRTFWLALQRMKNFDMEAERERRRYARPDRDRARDRDHDFFGDAPSDV